MPKTNIWCCAKNNFVSIKHFWYCTRSNLVSIRTSWCCTKKYFISTKISWWCQKKYFVFKKIINFFLERCTICYNYSSLFFWCDHTFYVKCWKNVLYYSKGNVQETVNTDFLTHYSPCVAYLYPLKISENL